MPGILGGIAQIIASAKNNKELKKLLAQDPTYTKNPLADQRLGLAQQLLNARMPGAADIERNIFANQANQISNINKASTDSSQALALATGTQGQTNNAVLQAGQMENQDYQRRYGNLSNAQDGAIAEDDKVYNDKIRKFDVLASIRGAQAHNRSQIAQSIGGMEEFGMKIASFGLSNGMFDGNQGGGYQGATGSRTTYVAPSGRFG